MDATTNIESCLPSHHVAKGSDLSLCSPQDEKLFPNIAKIFKKTLCVVGLKPVGRYVAQHTRDIGIIPLPMKTLLDRGTLHGDCITVAGRTIAETSTTVTRKTHQDVQRSTDRQITARGAVDGLLGIRASAGCGMGYLGIGRRRFDQAGTSDIIVNVNLSDEELAAHPSELGACATNHASRAQWDDARQVGSAENGLAIRSVRDFEKQCYADV